MTSSAEIKYFSGKKLSGKYGITIGTTLLIAGVNFVLSFIVQLIMEPFTLWALIAYEIVVFLIDLLLGTLISGQAFMYMNIIYDRQASFSDLRQGFSEHPEKAAALQVPTALAASIAVTPVNVYQLFFLESGDQNVLFICLAIALVGSVLEVAVELVFSQVFYLLHDFPDRSVMELFGASAKLMRGHKLQYFLLLLSYVPWLFISALLFFIPALFVISQMNAAQAAFYQRLVAPKEQVSSFDVMR